MKRALITGITGQDGAYLAASLLGFGYHVYGLCRRRSSDSLTRLVKLNIIDRKNLVLIDGDITDIGSLMRVFEDIKPDEIYNLAAQSFVGASWQQPLYTFQATGLGALNVFEAARVKCPQARVYQASSSEMFGNATQPVQDHNTPFNPKSPYAVAKVFAHHMAVNYRESFGIPISCGILFNHESPLRGLEFVTRKITHTVARIAHGQATELVLGNLEAKRDWGHAVDYTHAMHDMLQHPPDDYVIATGRTTSVREFCRLAFNCVGLDYNDYVKSDKALARPSDVQQLCGDASKATKILGWQPLISLEQLITTMVQADLDLVSSGQ